MIIIIFFILLILIGLSLLNPILPKFFCDKVGWHIAPKQTGFDGASFFGKCPRCKKNVLQDGQGNWF